MKNTVSLLMFMMYNSESRDDSVFCMSTICFLYSCDLFCLALPYFTLPYLNPSPHTSSYRNILHCTLQAGEMASMCGYRASAIMAEMEIEPNAVIIKKEEAEEEKVDAFGRLIGRKAAVLENRRRSKCVEGLLDRELKRRKRLEQWCRKLGVLPLPPAEFNSDANNQSITTSTTRQSIDNIGSIGIHKIKAEGGSWTSDMTSDSRIPEIVIKSEVKDENGNENDAKKISSQDNSTVGGVKRDHTSAVAGLGLGSQAQGRENELDQYYNPKKASRAGLGMGGLGSTPSSSSSSTSFSSTKASSKGGGSTVVTPFLSSFVKASAPAPSPSTVPALVPAPVFVPPPVFNNSKINSSSSSSADNSSSSRNGASDSTSCIPTLPALSHTDCLMEYETAVVLSGLESIPLGDSCDLDDSEVLGESVNTLPFPSLFLL